MGKRVARPKARRPAAKGKRLRLSKGADQVVSLRGGARMCPECGCNLHMLNVTLALLGGAAL